jgi:hypothetical protein
MKLIRVAFLQAAFALGGTMLCIVAAFFCLLFVFEGVFSVSGLLVFALAYGWTYLLAVLIMLGGLRITKGLQYRHRLWTLAIIGFAASYLCHALLSILTWYWSITLVMLVAATLTGWAALVDRIRPDVNRPEMFNDRFANSVHATRAKSSRLSNRQGQATWIENRFRRMRDRR